MKIKLKVAIVVSIIIASIFLMFISYGLHKVSEKHRVIPTMKENVQEVKYTLQKYDPGVKVWSNGTILHITFSSDARIDYIPSLEEYLHGRGAKAMIIEYFNGNQVLVPLVPYEK